MINKNYRRMRRKIYSLVAVVSVVVIITVSFFVVNLRSCDYRSTITFMFPSSSSEAKSIVFEPWQIPDWVQRYNVNHLFDWTWHKNGDFRRCRSSISRLPQSSKCTDQSTTVVNDVLDYFRSHPDEGCIVDNVARLPNLVPHPLPRARSFSDTCSSLHIDRQWILCSKPQSELDSWLPMTKRFITIAVFNAFVDTGHCHSEVPGTVFTEHATFHLQRWTNNRCANDPITNIPKIQPEYRHTELIDSIGTYLQAPGHFGPQQLPRLLRLLATVPQTAKVLVAKGGIADALIDVLVELGVVTRDRIIQFDKNIRPNHFANIVYRSDSWPYLKDKDNYHYIHDRTDMQLVHRVITANQLLPINKKNCIILIKRENGHPRSIIEHSQLFGLIESMINNSKISSHLHIEIFEARGHIRDHIALFQRARIIIGSHGAGMMNMLWSSPGTHVVEIGYDTGMIFPEMYAEMSLHLEHHYWICKGRGDYSSSIHIDIEDFTYIFNNIIHQIQIQDES